jgi:hypothetical protein
MQHQNVVLTLLQDPVDFARLTRRHWKAQCRQGTVRRYTDDCRADPTPVGDHQRLGRCAADDVDHVAEAPLGGN